MFFPGPWWFPPLPLSPRPTWLPSPGSYGQVIVTGSWSGNNRHIILKIDTQYIPPQLTLWQGNHGRSPEVNTILLRQQWKDVDNDDNVTAMVIGNKYPLWWSQATFVPGLPVPKPWDGAVGCLAQEPLLHTTLLRAWVAHGQVQDHVLLTVILTILLVLRLLNPVGPGFLQAGDSSHLIIFPLAQCRTTYLISNRWHSLLMTMTMISRLIRIKPGVWWPSPPPDPPRREGRPESKEEGAAHQETSQCIHALYEGEEREE